MLSTAEVVTESGGMVSESGNLNIAIIAKHYKKPVYIVINIFRFWNRIIIDNDDIPTNE